jgi:hypothetical protein
LYGGAFNTCARGAKSFYGRGTGYQLDSTQRFTVVTGFVTVDGTDNGELREMHSASTSRTAAPPSSRRSADSNCLSDGFCNFYGQSNGQGGVSYGMSQGMRRGMVLSMSMWGSPNDPSSMTCMDNEPNGPCPVYQNPNNP